MINFDEIQYDTPIEVNKNQYDVISKIPAIAHRYDLKTDKYYIKLWNSKYKKVVHNLINLLE